jgi:hypothetical protein
MQGTRRAGRRREHATHISLATRSASTPTGQCVTAVTCPSASIPRGVVSNPQTRMHVEVKCLGRRQYKYKGKKEEGGREEGRKGRERGSRNGRRRGGTRDGEGDEGKKGGSREEKME